MPIAVLLLLLTGCSTGLRAQVDASPSLSLPDQPQIIRVRVLKSKKPLKLSCTGPFQYQSRRGGKTYDVNYGVQVKAMGSALVFNQKRMKGGVIVSAFSPKDFLKLNGRRFRGTLVFHPLGRGYFDVVEYLDIQNYLYGVLPREVGGDWPLESLKAQAVVSRTYVMANKATGPDQRFDVFNDVTHQVYGGLDDEAPAANQAVDQTNEEILTDSQGKIAQTFFHSSCGGMTETPDNVWFRQDATDVFGSIKDDFCKEDPYMHWKADLKLSVIRARLRRAGYRLGEIRKISIGKKSSSDRALTFVVTTSVGKTEIQGNRFRIAVGPEALRSTLLTELNSGKRSVHFEGRGWGHGVGLCQWGAKGRAAAGQKYDEILKAYYPGATLKRIQTP